MRVRCLVPTAFVFCSAFPALAASDPPPVQDMPSEQDAAAIEAHASAWHLLLKREQLRVLTKRWSASLANPDSAAACYAVMLPVADGIVDEIALTTGFPRAALMRWLEDDVGLKPYFFPPQPEQVVESKKSGVWKFLSPLVPIILYRVVDRMLD